MKIQAMSRFGNFAYTATAEVDNGTLEALAHAGLLQVLQRSPASAAEKAMAGYDKRPAGFDRGSLPFTEANAAILKRELEKAKAGEEGELELLLDVTVSEHVPTERETKYGTAKAMIRAKSGDVSRLRKLATVVEYDGGGALTVENEDFVLAVNRFIKEV